MRQAGCHYICFTDEDPELQRDKIALPTSPCQWWLSRTGARPPGFCLWQPTWGCHSVLCLSGVGVLSGQLYATGGHDGPLVRKSVEVYDPGTNTWKQVADMNMCRRNAGNMMAPPSFPCGEVVGVFSLQTLALKEAEWRAPMAWGWACILSRECPFAGQGEHGTPKASQRAPSQRQKVPSLPVKHSDFHCPWMDSGPEELCAQAQWLCWVAKPRAVWTGPHNDTWSYLFFDDVWLKEPLAFPQKLISFLSVVSMKGFVIHYPKGPLSLFSCLYFLSLLPFSSPLLFLPVGMIFLRVFRFVPGGWYRY